MTRDIKTYFSTDSTDQSAVEVEPRGVTVTDSIGGGVFLDWDEYDRLVAEVTRLRPLVTQEAA